LSRLQQNDGERRKIAFMQCGFMLEIDGVLYSEADGFMPLGDLYTEHQVNGSVVEKERFGRRNGSIEVSRCKVRYPDTPIEEVWIDVKNTGESDAVVTRADSIHVLLPPGSYTLRYFASSHGGEFTPIVKPLAGTQVLESTSGRSSSDLHPWLCIEGADGSLFVCAMAWSGNWIIRLEPTPRGAYRITGGLSNWQFAKVLKPSERFESISVVMLSLSRGNLDDARIHFGRWGRKYGYPSNSLARSMPVEYNPWYPYTDSGIHEQVFKANVDRCQELGIDVCTLDAGWFGSETDPDWYYVRGDWNRVHSGRFPSGIRAISDYVHSRGMKFGIWCEIEAVGRDAELNRQHPDWVATRNGNSLGYICLGNEAAFQWAYRVLEFLIVGYGADWIKLDFNLSPGAGCNRIDHGHGEGDGLYEHYRGLYRLLDIVRAHYPEVILESCSGGGLRLDLGIQKRVHLSFLSDPDYAPHALQVFWGASIMLHPSSCLHWSWSQTVPAHKKNGDNNPIKPHMPVYKFDYLIRIALLKNPGFSYKLNEFPPWCLKRLKEHIEFYKRTMMRFVRDGDLYVLTEQPGRNGDGDRWCGFQYVSEDKRESLVVVFRLPGGESERTMRLKGLDADAAYGLTFIDSNQYLEKRGRELSDAGLVFAGMEEESSAVILLARLAE
jgi:alpha-galactosidase